MVVCLMVGIQGSGKSTWAHEMASNLARVDTTSAIISRDEIRKSLVGEEITNTAQYFSKETEVFNEFIHQANEAMKNVDCVFIDATHVSPASRRKTISKLTPPEGAQLFIKIMETSFDECIERNSKRKGFSFVPTKAIARMNRQFVIPTKSEFDFDWNPFKEVILSKEGEQS